MAQPGEPERSFAILLTREVRWFHLGSVPPDVVTWFTASGSAGEAERRIDRYDRAATRDGIGVKQRNSGTVETKMLLTRSHGVDLAPGMVGNVEEWVKITEPGALPADLAGWDQVEVVKDIVTRRYLLDGRPVPAAGPAGCEVELASITLGSLQAWSLCFETFGPVGWRGEALRMGVSRLFEDSPPVENLGLSAGNSSGYPEWIAKLSLGTAGLSA